MRTGISCRRLASLLFQIKQLLFSWQCRVGLHERRIDDHSIENVIFKRSRQREGGYSFDPGSFVPVAFSIWDGREGERGARRGVTGWYHMYLEPLQAESKLIPVAGYGLLTLLLEVGVIVVVRKRNGSGGNG